MLRFTHIATTLSLTRYNYPGIELGTGRVGRCSPSSSSSAPTNAVNLTDGLDGLAAGSSIFGFAAFVVIGFWGFRHPSIYGDQSFLDLAVVVGVDARRVHRVPVVERGAGPHLHGRHRLAGHRRRRWPASRSAPTPACCWS